MPCGYRSQRESFTNFFKCRELLSWLDSFLTYQPRSSNWSLQLRVRLITIRICIRKEYGICDINLQPIWPTVFLVCKNPQFMNCFEAKPSDSQIYSPPFEFEILNKGKKLNKIKTDKQTNKQKIGWGDSLPDLLDIGGDNNSRNRSSKWTPFRRNEMTNHLETLIYTSIYLSTFRDRVMHVYELNLLLLAVQ